jgi:nicotinic acid mononucleotide adenylyltransferase
MEVPSIKPVIIDQMLKDQAEGHDIVIVNGGSFAPPTNAHTAYPKGLVKELKNQGIHVAQVILVPTYVNPEKIAQLKPFTPTPEQKVGLLQQSIEDDDILTIDDQEVKRIGASYTYQTVDNITKILEGKITEPIEGQVTQKTLDIFKGRTSKNTKIYLLMSTETAAGDGVKAGGFYTWGEPDFIVKNVRLLYANRPGTPFDSVKLRNTMLKVNELVKEGKLETQTVKVVASHGKEEDVLIEESLLKGLDGKRKAKITKLNLVDHAEAQKIEAISQEVMATLLNGYFDYTCSANVSSTMIRAVLADQTTDLEQKRTSLHTMMHPEAADAYIEMFKDQIK